MLVEARSRRDRGATLVFPCLRPREPPSQKIERLRVGPNPDPHRPAEDRPPQRSAPSPRHQLRHHWAVQRPGTGQQWAETLGNALDLDVVAAPHLQCIPVQPKVWAGSDARNPEARICTGNLARSLPVAPLVGARDRRNHWCFRAITRTGVLVLPPEHHSAHGACRPCPSLCPARRARGILAWTCAFGLACWTIRQARIVWRALLDRMPTCPVIRPTC